MGWWSTNQLAALAGTTERAIRHYHHVGLLAQPERRANGYKRYGVTHLVRVLRIKRLTGLGLSLAQIAELGDADEHPEKALRALDSELAESIERMRRARADLAVILDQAAPTDLPPELGRALADAGAPATERSMGVVLSQVLGPAPLGAYVETLRTCGSEPTLAEFDALPANADERTRQDLAERMLETPSVRKMLTAFPTFEDTSADSPHGAEFALNAITRAVAELYNPAQIDVLVRMNC
ncbi:MerR family transcriptional regulator [Amycolatopsis saalfeldensis]|uniref:DNA-binding transcriptional regulator, MerR family n=1 Tax=Amycolatopsis saalfeldensis TaxID=394193 RepID=A0A1H8RC33_9PSEU|nr:MerR family transcriptional regulator [Amycolatopsis saalfeldensis]SEO63728.1 DNA-binding transcriptional regulator, MerR family [Amycolatopsis saalfeldensis]